VSKRRRSAKIRRKGPSGLENGSSGSAGDPSVSTRHLTAWTLFDVASEGDAGSQSEGGNSPSPSPGCPTCGNFGLKLTRAPDNRAPDRKPSTGFEESAGPIIYGISVVARGGWRQWLKMTLFVVVLFGLLIGASWLLGLQIAMGPFVIRGHP